MQRITCKACKNKQGPTRRSRVSPRIYISKRFPGTVMLLVQGPHSENHCPKLWCPLTNPEVFLEHLPVPNPGDTEQGPRGKTLEERITRMEKSKDTICVSPGGKAVWSEEQVRKEQNHLEKARLGLGLVRLGELGGEQQGFRGRTHRAYLGKCKGRGALQPVSARGFIVMIMMMAAATIDGAVTTSHWAEFKPQSNLVRFIIAPVMATVLCWTLGFSRGTEAGHTGVT